MVHRFKTYSQSTIFPKCNEQAATALDTDHKMTTSLLTGVLSIRMHGHSCRLWIILIRAKMQELQETAYATCVIHLARG